MSCTSDVGQNDGKPLQRCGKDFRESFTALCTMIHASARDHGFWDSELNFGEKIALVHSELSEALEKNRKGVNNGLGLADEHCPQHSGVAIELADAIIRIMDLAGYLGMDIGAAIIENMNFNSNRPYLHGKTS